MPLGQLMARAGTSESVDASRPYPTLGVKSHAQGAFDSGVLQGASTAYKTLTQLESGWLVYPKLMAWEGALAVVPTELGGRCVTPEFVAYDVKGEALSREYLRHLIAWSGFLDWVRAGSAGTNVRRRRLQPAAFEAIRIPLPSRSDQDLIAAHLTALSDGAVHSGDRPKASIDAVVSLWLDSLPHRPLGQLAEVGPRPVRLAPDSSIDFVPMEAVDAVTGSIVGAQQRVRSDLASGYRQFQVGDVIFARITPSMQNGKSALYEGYNARVGYGSTEFHVLRPRDDRYTRWIWALLRTQWFISRAREAFTGTAGQQRVPASFLEHAEVPIPAPSQLSGAIQRLIDVRERMNEIHGIALRRDELAKSILPAARNEIFSAMR